jgi:retinoid hydroxylase
MSTDNNTPLAQKPLPPGSDGLPFIGETLTFLFRPSVLRERSKLTGSITRTHILGRPTMIMFGSEANRFVLQKGMGMLSWKNGWPATFRELLGQSLFLQDGEEHRRNRRLLLPAFHKQALASYFDSMNSVIKTYLDKWAQQQTFPWFSELKQMTFEIASVLLIGGETGKTVSRLSQLFTEMTNGLFQVPLRMSWTPYGKALAARDAIRQYLLEAIDRRYTTPMNDALGLLVQSRDEDGSALTRDEIMHQAMLLVFAGHETTTSMLTSLGMALAQNPDVWRKLEAEQAALNIEGDVTLDHLRQMPYLEQVLKEIERLYPPVAGGFRGVEEDFEFNGYRIPKGYTVQWSIIGTHQDDRIYTNPKQFDPERFSPERAEGEGVPFSLVGFGGGPRICIGQQFAQMEMKIYASYLIRHYTWTLLSKQPVKMSNFPTLHPVDNLPVQFRRR